MTTLIPSEDIFEQVTSMKVRMDKIEAEMKERMERMAKVEERMGKIEAETIVESRTAKIRADIQRIEQDLKEISSRVSSEIFVNVHSKSYILLIAQIHIRVLLDKAREKIVKESHDSSWEDLCNSCEISELKRTIPSTHSMSDDLTNFIYKFTILIKNITIRLAAHQEPEPDGAESQMKQQLYQFAFNEDHDINFGDLDGL